MGDCPPPIYDPPPGCSWESPCMIAYAEQWGELHDLWLEDPETHCPQFLEGNETAYAEAEQCCAQQT